MSTCCSFGQCPQCEARDEAKARFRKLKDEALQKAVKELIAEIDAEMPKTPPPLATMARENCVCPHCTFHNGRF